MFGRKRRACSFCGRGEAEVAKLVAGPGAHICDRCTADVMRIKDQAEPPSLMPERPGGLLGRLLRLGSSLTIAGLPRLWHHRFVGLAPAVP